MYDINRFNRVDFGQSKEETLIGIGITQLVFELNSKIPMALSSEELFSKGKYPDVLCHQLMIEGITSLIEFLNKALVGRQIESCNNYSVVNHVNNTVYYFGNKSEPLAIAVAKVVRTFSD